MNKADPYVRLVVLLGSLAALTSGAWAFISPASFYDAIAPYPPFSPHFVRDAGAAALGFSALLAIALRWKDPIAVALVGLSVGSVFHALSHLIDIDTRPGDFVGLAIFAAVLILGLVRRLRTYGSESEMSRSRAPAG